MKPTKPVFVALLLAAGCSSGPPQVITGRISPDFPMTVTKVVVRHGNTTVASSPIAADDTFRLEVPAHSGLRLALVGEAHSTVVFPRQAGTLDTAFVIRGSGADFDLGMVRFVGAAPATAFVFKPGSTTGGGGAECEDGHDASGAVCVDDEDSDNNTCGQDDQQEGDHEDGDANDGEHDDGETNDDGEQADDGPDVGDAVAEHNFPADGCNDDEQDGESNDD